MEMEFEEDCGDFCSKLCGKLDKFRREKLHCDVDLQVGQQVFPCHKVVISAVSSYFSSMFSGQLQESEKKNIVLDGMDAAIFENVLSFMYTGEITITSENFYQLLVASQYLGMQFIEDECTSYIYWDSNNVPVDNAIEIFLIAFARENKKLLKVLSRYIAENVASFCNQYKFLEIPYDAVKIIFNAVGQRDELLHAIIRWVRHSSDQRKEIVPELLKMVHCEEVSAAFVQLLSECVIEAEPAHEDLHKQCGNSLTLPAIETSSVKRNLLNISALNVFVSSKFLSAPFLHQYGVDKNYQWHDVHVQAERRIVSCKNVAVGEKLYYFSYSYTEGCNNLTCWFRHQFTRSTDMNKYSFANAPPCQISHFDACSIQTNIYLYNQEYSKFKSSAGYRDFTADENSRSIYRYESDLDIWYPVARPECQLDGSYIVSCNDVVYLLGGYYPIRDESVDRGYVQSYDHRMGTWNQLPDTTFRYEDASACVHDGKIYIAGGSRCPQAVEVFDPKAGKWEIVKPMNCGRMWHKLISYNNYLWAIGNATDLSVEIYDQKANHWINTTSMAEAVNSVDEKIPGSVLYHTVLDAVVFEYYKDDQRDEDDHMDEDDYGYL